MMDNMIKKQNHVALQVRTYLDQDPFIQKDMSRNIINIRALSRYIIKEQKLKTSLDAVISTIRRYNNTYHETIYENAKKIIGKIISISTKNQIISIDVIKDTEVQQLLPKLYSIVNYDQGDVLNITHTEESIILYTNENKLEQIKKIIPEYKINQIYKNLASINIRVKKDAYKTPGIIALIANDLAIHNINVIEFTSCAQELLWFVEDKDLLDAYRIINNLWQQNINRDSQDK
jgi:aspartokinase